MNEFIRKAALDDVDKINAIEHRVFSDPWSRDQIIQELKTRANRLVNVLLGDEYIGYIMVYCKNTEAHILNFAIDIPYQHRGYGKKLLKNTLYEVGLKTAVFLEVRKSNLSAIKLYSDFNFEDIGLREHYYSDGENALIMKRKKHYGLV